jgi:hypothetical protein
MKMMFGCFGLATALKLRNNAQIMVKTVFIDKRGMDFGVFGQELEANAWDGDLRQGETCPSLYSRL